ncbi:cytochrome c3 family protein [Deferrisoma camini]|uniref:cytochrome c3 family protein n=1 Tax=Deferrisoma camini TaxID=1035120 RepID=UPI00046D4FFB|nr:cytochrome c3 family protein [Deferrisoma camini]
MRWVGWVLAAFLGGWAVAAGARETRVLAPVPDQAPGPQGLWLVLEAPAPPEVRSGDARMPVARAEDGVYHVRLPVGPDGAVRARVDVGGKRIILERLPGGRGRFHGAAGAGACGRCHDAGACEECHRWQGEAHGALRRAGCGGCHEGARRAVDDVESLCTRCHDDVRKRHRRFRHALRGGRDPRRPGRPLGCTSCHDPHSPAPLSGLDRAALRKWCKGCHGR